MDVEKITLSQLIKSIKKLTIRSVIVMLGILSTILTGTFFLGRQWEKYENKNSNSERHSEIALDTEFTDIQKRIKSLEPIKVFESNRNALKNENWAEAYSTFSPYMQKYLAPNNRSDFLKYHYRMLNKYESKIYIPEKITDSEAQFIVHWKYSDVRPVLSEFESLITRPVIDVLSDECISKLKKDIFLELPNHYVVKDTNMITEYIDNCFKVLRYRDLISKRFSLIDEIGRKNDLEPIYVKPLVQGDYKDSDCEACSRLKMIKVGNQWKVEDFSTLLISRKNE